MENITKNNAMIARFMGRKFKAYRDNSSFNIDFDTYEECMQYIKDKNLKDYYPELGWRLGCGSYHESWDALMPVVEKIEATTVLLQIDQNDDPEFEPDIREEEWQFSVEIVNSQCMINQDVLPQFYGTDTDFLKTYDCRYEGTITKIEAVYRAVIQFITWYNQQPK
jgi:hypothetical protein